ncbi:hypothetical protein LB503_011262 [Fusarium chuoi]|nr:hypothetical protein LB503_011262 [Fusarium chuoi]
MELADGSTDIVHPEVRAHINSLVSALGGISADDDGGYQLGDDALEVLRDLKRWIRFYDEKTNRMDVARCIHEANLIEGDLLPILSTWPENATDSKFNLGLLRTHGSSHLADGKGQRANDGQSPPPYAGPGACPGWI